MKVLHMAADVAEKEGLTSFCGRYVQDKRKIGPGEG
jgi:hypothetical protein